MPRVASPDRWVDRLEAIVSGAAGGTEIERWVNAAWAAGELVSTLPQGVVERLPDTGRPVTRYGDSGILRSAVCFRHANGAGGVVVHTPPMQGWQATDGSYCIPPHVHRQHHLTVVLRGAAQFFIACEDGRGCRVVRLAVGPGDLLPCPAHVPHTFGSTGGAFTVLSIQARFVEPSHPDFARDSDMFAGLPQVLQAPHHTQAESRRLDGVQTR